MRGNRSTRGRREAGNAMVLVALLLLIVVGGAYNYQRNMQAEKSEQGARPFKGYATDDLSALRDAYDQEVAAYERTYAARQRQRVRATNSGAMNQQVDQFERVQRNSAALREATADVAEREAQLRAIERELELRLALGGGFSLHIKRLTRI